MRRVLARLGSLGAIALVLATGCNTPNYDRWRWPWEKVSPLAEEYKVPPVTDERYSEYPTLPRSVIKPGLKPQEPTDPKRNPGMGAPGMMPPGGRPTGAGNLGY